MTNRGHLMSFFAQSFSRFGITEDLTQHTFVLTVFSFFLFPSSFSCLLNSGKNFIIRSLILLSFPSQLFTRQLTKSRQEIEGHRRSMK